MAMKTLRHGPGFDITLALALASMVSFVLYGLVVHRAGQAVFTYLPSNLILAWIPLGLAVWLSTLLRKNLWSSWPTLVVTALWLMFLPNSFYMITDLVHLSGIYAEDLVVTTAVFFAFALTGLLLGYMSLYLVHLRLRERLQAHFAFGFVLLTLLMCSLAIYIGRDLRWNSWDVLVSPSGLLFDLTYRLFHPSEYGTILVVAGGFFVLLVGLYVSLLRLVRALRHVPKL